MNIKNVLIGLFCITTISFSNAQINEGTNKVIYKWINEGQVSYAYIKPTGLENSQYVKLDGKGREIEEFSEDFGELVEVIKPPEEAKPEVDTNAKDGDTDTDKKLKADKEAKLRVKNCETSKANMEMVKSGEVYDKDENGNMIRLKPEQMNDRKESIEKDVAYWCN